MPRMFKEIELPETCYIQEVVYWFALGRAPDFYFDGHGDARRGENSFETGEMVDYDPGFSELEFRSIGISIDYSRYSEARTFIQDGDVDEYVAQWDERFARYQPTDGEDSQALELWKREQLNRIIHDAEEGRWALKMEEAFEQTIDLARMRVFQALAGGDLKAVGWVADLTADDEAPKGHFEEIPATYWTLVRFNWAENRLRHDNKAFEAVQVHSEQMLQVFPKPNCEAVNVSMRAYPGVAIVQDAISEKSVAKPKPARGRPPKAVQSIGDAVRNWHQARYGNKMPPKAEAVIEEARAFVRDIFKQDASRSTIQYWLTGLAALPENHASNSTNSAAA